MDVDVLVVGGGPVGLATAVRGRALAGLRRGRRRAAAGPVDKACGEGLMPAAVAVARAARRRVAGRAVRAASATSAPGTGRRGAVPSPARGRRPAQTLHAALAARADEARRRAGLRRGPRPRPERGRRRRSPGCGPAGWPRPTACTRRYAGCSGWTRARPGGRPRYGLRRHYRGGAVDELVEVHWARARRGVRDPGRRGRRRGRGARPRRRHGLRRAAGAVPRAARARHGRRPGDRRARRGPAAAAGARRVAGRVLLVGDAAGYVDALTGEGISVGLRLRARAGPVRGRGRPQEYERAWLRATRRYRVLTGGLLWAAQRPRVRRTIVPAAERLPAVFGRIVDQLG